MFLKKTPEYYSLVNSLADKGYHHFFGVRRELKYLAKIKPDNEELIAAVRAFVNRNHTVLCCLTSQRILFLDLGLFYSANSSQVPLRKVNGVSHNAGLWFCDLIVTNSAENIVINTVLVSQANKFISDVNAAMVKLDSDSNSSGHFSGADELLKYEHLYKSGILTRDEFEHKKAQILNDMD